MDLFDNDGLLTYSIISMIISLSDLVGMCKIQKNSYFQTRSERLIIIHIIIIIIIIIYYLFGANIYMNIFKCALQVTLK